LEISFDCLAVEPLLGESRTRLKNVGDCRKADGISPLGRSEVSLRFRDRRSFGREQCGGGHVREVRSFRL